MTALLKAEEVAEQLRLSKAQVYALIAEGVLPSVRIARSVRIPAAALEAWLSEQESAARPALAGAR